jgi:hypothetical protein
MRLILCNLGIAVGAGSHVAADMVLIRDQLADVVMALDLAKVVFNRIKLNFLWATAYNFIAILFAAACWYPFYQVSIPPQYAGKSAQRSRTGGGGRDPSIVILCYAMLCHSMLCYAMPCYVMLCHAMPCFAMLCCPMLFLLIIDYRRFLTTNPTGPLPLPLLPCYSSVHGAVVRVPGGVLLHAAPLQEAAPAAGRRHRRGCS